MPKSARIWQAISLLLAVALAAVLIAVHHTTGTLPTVNSLSDAPTLVLSPAARRTQERYSL